MQLSSNTTIIIPFRFQDSCQDKQGSVPHFPLQPPQKTNLAPETFIDLPLKHQTLSKDGRRIPSRVNQSSGVVGKIFSDAWLVCQGHTECQISDHIEIFFQIRLVGIFKKVPTFLCNMGIAQLQGSSQHLLISSLMLLGLQELVTPWSFLFTIIYFF